MKTTTALKWTVCLAMGFTLGWLGRSWSIASIRVAEPRAVMMPGPAAKPAPLTVAPVHTDDETATGPKLARKTPRNETAERLSALAGAKKYGFGFVVPVIGPNGLEPTFAKLYGLTDAEVAVLNEAIAATKARFDALAMQNARPVPSGDPSHVIVEVPPAEAEGGAMYDQLLQTFKDVLGPDRFQSFNDLSGETFDHALNSFGLATTRYELAATGQSTRSGTPLYQVTVSSKAPNGSWNSINTTTFKQVLANYPALAQFIPAGFDSQPGRK